jgi:hypothetical protein
MTCPYRDDDITKMDYVIYGLFAIGLAALVWFAC